MTTGRKSAAKTVVRDLRTDPFLRISKAFYALKPSQIAICAYNSLIYFSCSQTGVTQYTSIPRMAALVSLSVRGFQKATTELAKKRAIKVHHRWQKTLDGKKIQLPNAYDLLDLKIGGKDDDF